MILDKKDLEIVLSNLKSFENPKFELEQYSTPSDLAADLLWQAFMDGNIHNKVVVDLGCGTGILAFGASMLGAEIVYGFDVDNEALKTAEENLKRLKEIKIILKKIIFMKKDVSEVNKLCDTVIMNPPFGIQTHKADRPFLEKAFELSNFVYSIHSVNSGRYLKAFAEEHNFNAALIKKGKIILPPTMKFHTKSKYPINVEIWRFVRVQK